MVVGSVAMMAFRSPRSGLLRAYVAPHRRAVGGLAAALVIATGLPLVGPQLVKRFIDDATSGAPTARLVAIALVYVGVALVAQAVAVAASYWAGRVAWTATNALREDLTRHVLRLDIGFHSRHAPGELIERIDGDVVALSNFAAYFLPQIATASVTLLGVLVLVWLEDVRIGAVLTLIVLIAAGLTQRMQKRIVPAASRDRAAVARVLGGIEEWVAGAEDLRALGAGSYALEQLRRHSADSFEASRRWQVLSGGVLFLTNFVFSSGTAVVLGAAILALRHGALTLGAVVLVFQYTTMLRRPIDQLVGQFKEFQAAAAGVVRVRELLATAPAIRPPDDGVELPPGPLAVSLDDVTFAYEGDDAVLHDVSIAIAAGRSLGVVGRTGSGKTTIARLLLRLQDPGAGQVRVGGIDLRTVAEASRRDRIRIVTQDVQVFSATVRDNLTLFDGAFDDAALVSVLDDVGLASWFGRLPDGLDARLGVDGAGLSAGESQLLAFARVFLADPGLVVLDEASSRLDPATEALVDRAIDRLLARRTAVVIAHRLSSLDRVDDIVVLDHGRVVEFGGREELASSPTSRFHRLLSLSGVSA
jgi:ATP-binding cassette subfamily B protein/ATP-binding cassette subfamily C protein